MIAVGLTGGIGSGKSTVAAMLVRHGAIVIDADEIARQVVEPGLPGFAKVVERFGQRVVGSNGKLDRAALAAIVFEDKASLSDLEAIVHPQVRTEIARRLTTESGRDDVVVVEIPLLVEGGAAQEYGLAGVLVVDVPPELALERLVQIREMDPRDAKARIANQAGRAERIAAADFVIMNMGTLDELEEMVRRAWEWIGSLGGQGRVGGAGKGAR